MSEAYAGRQWDVECENNDLRLENAKLREERDHWHVEQVHAFGNWEDSHKRAVELEAENAKLRELVRDLLHHIEYPPCEGCLSEMSCAGDLSQCDEYFDWLKPRARKLGVEVDE